MPPHKSGPGALVACSPGRLSSSSLALAALLLLSTQAAFAQAVADLPNFRLVSPGIYRGGQPSEKGLERLKENGVKTVLSFRTERRIVALEAAQARALGLSFVSIPISGVRSPGNQELHQFLNLVQDKEARPIYMHCQEGLIRTGVMVALYREASEKWPAPRAYEEMVSNGFQRSYLWLSNHLFDYNAQEGEQIQPPWRCRVARAIKQSVLAPRLIVDMLTPTKFYDLPDPMLPAPQAWKQQSSLQKSAASGT